ncbi:lysophospholipid acyltransferase family protein [Alteriqipengyuania lutimaris]|uniref:1-acyl-sn-glycerol-3-phosphate acyltransferase n=1 Tax=Alteriqipengyuania lutimaris TaxID=1538146 RepID=A0A395LJQ8_9SPHN|nr:lysophospholipid acyltransferase family protein [Alteriqipengyuania lutimaris]MBB3033813.1 1-acyl-sn-glycerol-3-phosphate acyltransferase [Alteriqipengyuania lutimaris]RDS77213.1 1-acyl-sn-glycerol-3-phosphate acyltransferase [Alteriqipengyuania lutimaris]
MNLLRSLLFYLAFYSGTFVLLLIAPFQRRAGMRRVAGAWSGLHRWCVRHILRIRVIHEGAPIDGPALYAMRHESFFEAIDAPCVFGWPVIFAKRELLELPVWGNAAATYGIIPVARDEGAKALRGLMRAARDAKDEGRPFLIFPEGTRTPHGEEAPIVSGFAGLYKLLDLPVVPVAVNSGPLYRGFVKQTGQITYRFGEAIAPGLDRKEVERQVREAINALNA